jgi:drug/metabolite transporter (DMT)-like permease
MSWCYFAALNHAPASLVALLLYTYPTIVTVLAAIFLHERITMRKLGALLLCGLGTLLVIGPNLAASTAGASLTGIGLALSAAAIYALYIVVGTRITRGVDPIMTTTIVCISAAVVLAVVAVLSGMNGMPPRVPLSLAGWGGVAGVALVSTVVAVIAFFAGLKRLGASLASMLSTLEPVVTVLLAGWLLAESLVGWQWLGGALTLGGVLWLAAGGKPAAADADRKTPAAATHSSDI